MNTKYRKTTNVTVAEYAKAEHVSESKARYALNKMVKHGNATRSVVWTSVPSSLHNCRAEFSFRKAIYTIPMSA
jgi:hypothetical protein